jgi:hypothetical protein
MMEQLHVIFLNLVQAVVTTHKENAKTVTIITGDANSVTSSTLYQNLPERRGEISRRMRRKLNSIERTARAYFEGLGAIRG